MIDDPESLHYVRPVRLWSHDVLFALALTIAAIVVSSIAIVSGRQADSPLRLQVGTDDTREMLPVWPASEVGPARDLVRR